ncbi:hypothetical protein ABEF95_016334 [Exophiala dermatitidis]
MSTFNGLVKEFPNIRVDYFRTHPGKPPPAAYFLSHVHSDHLLGLESVKMPFVYCSATTRRILLKLEKYPHRINFAKGILESRKQHYRHLKTILRPLPLHVSTELELGPKSTIKVTLLDANHCPGAVMFLIEGDSKAILYTGDIRAEPWWVNSIVQNPVILPYTCRLKTLDCIYLDTTFASHDEPYREFPTKAEGLKELLEKVGQCSPDTIFYFRAWTLGYEDVWVALPNYVNSRVHVDDYQLRIFRPSKDSGEDSVHNEGAALTGFMVGNHTRPGCLSSETNARIHSCEPGSKCHSNIKRLRNIKWITPIISRLQDGTEVRELGAGGGGGDLYQTSDLRLDDLAALQQLATMCADITDDEAVSKILRDEVTKAQKSQRFNMILEGVDNLHSEENPITLKDFLVLLSKLHSSMHTGAESSVPVNKKRKRKREEEDTQETESQDDDHLEEFYQSARTNVDRASASGTGAKVASGESIPSNPKQDDLIESDEEKVYITLDEDSEDDCESLSVFESISGEQLDVLASSRSVAKSTKEPPSQCQSRAAGENGILVDDKLSRRHARLEAYWAARHCLVRNDSSHWDDLSLRSAGHRGHDEEELEL